MASAGFDDLQPELLDTIFGFQDVPTLCTARLVCVKFRDAASRFIRSVEISAKALRSHPGTTLNNFPNLSRVTIFGLEKEDLRMLALSPVGHAVTQVCAVEYLWPVPPRTRNAADFPVLPLPNLTSMTSDGGVPPFPQTLRELRLNVKWSAPYRTVKSVTRLTNLTCLEVSVRDWRRPFVAVTALTALQRLETWSELSNIPFLAELTLLTHLQFHVEWRADPLSYLASLTLLHRLVHLGVRHRRGGQWSASLERQVLASIAPFTSLRSLDIILCKRPEQSAFETVLMTPFSQLTALKLGSNVYGLDVSFLHRFSLERLQDLSLSLGLQLDQAGVVALGGATGLTHLELWKVGAVVKQEVATALSRMSGLRSLSLCTTNPFLATVCSNAIGLLTELTRLRLLKWGVTTSADLEVFLGLKKLRVLGVYVSCTAAPSGGITPETIFAIAKLPELRKLKLDGSVGLSEEDLTDNVRKLLNADRHDMGWPPCELSVSGPGLASL